MGSRRDPTWIILLIGVLALVAIVPSTMMGGWGTGLGMMGLGFMWPFMFLVPLAFVVLIALGLWYLLSGLQKARVFSSYVESDANRILNERYARGEITSEQYTKMKKDLETSG